MNSINAILTQLGEWLLGPFAASPLVGLVIWSAIAGLVMSLVFGKTSNQRALKRAADSSRAQMLAIKLFKDDLAVTFRCQFELLKATAMRLFHSLPPMFVMIIPFAFVLSQFALRYEHEPLTPGQTTVVELNLSESAWDQYKDVKIEAPDTILVETQSLRDNTQEDSKRNHTLYWRLRAKSDEPATLSWQFGDEIVQKRIAVAANTDRLLPVSVRRPGTNLFERLFHPGEPAFSREAPVRGIVLYHPKRSTPLLGLDLPWWGTFFIVSILAALIVGRWRGVQY